jgi:hypothetical protein
MSSRTGAMTIAETLRRPGAVASARRLEGDAPAAIRRGMSMMTLARSR